MDLSIIASTSAHSNFQQLINQVEPFTRVVLKCSSAKSGFAALASFGTHGRPTLGRD